MAKQYKDKLSSSQNKPAASTAPDSGASKVKFLIWFTEAQSRFEGIKPHHMSGIKAFCSSLGLDEFEFPEAFDDALLKYGFKKI